MPDFTNTSVAELSVLRGVAVFLWSNAIKDGHLKIAVFPLFKVPHVSSSVAEDTTLRIFFHSMWIGPFLLRLGFIGFGDGQSLRYKCPA